MADIRITPASSVMSFTSSLNYIEKITQDASGSLNLYGSGSTGRTELLSIDGNNGRLFTVSDDLSDSLFSVNTIAGLPVIEAFADNTVKMGQYGQNVLVVTGSSVGIGKSNPDAFRLDAKGSGSIGALKIQKSTGGYLMQGLDGDGYTMIEASGDLANSNMQISLGDAGEAYSQPKFNINSTNIQFSSTNVGINATPSSNKLAVGGTVGLQASALGSAATQILVTSADPSSTTRTVQTRTPAQLRGDIGAGVGSVTSVGGTGTVSGLSLSGTVTSTGNLTLGGTLSLTAANVNAVGTITNSTSGTATNATNITITNDTATNATYYPVFVSATSGNTAARVDSSTLTYNPSTNTLTASSLGVTSISLASLHSIYNYSNTLVITANSGTTISLGGGPGSVQNNVNVANGTLAVGTTSVLGKFHVYQSTNLGGTAGNNLILQTLQNTGGSGGNNVYIKDYAVRDATGTDWLTWRHHNSIDIDSAYNTPGTNTRCFWERDPLSGFHYFGHSAVYTMTIDGANSRVGISNTAPGYPLHVNADNGGTSIYASADIVAYSDVSVKENIRPIENVIERITQSRGVLYDRTDIESKDNIGFIAQELEVAFPELVVTNEDGTKAVKYQNTVAVLFEAIKEQQKQIDELKQIVNGITG